MLEHTLRTYQSPTRLVQRLGAIRELGNEAGLLGIRRPLLVTDPGVKAAGLLDTALEALRGSDCEPVVFDRVKANPGIELVDSGAAEYRAQGCDGLVAIGGGSSMDTAKGIGVVAAHDGSIVDYEWGHSPIKSRIPPMIAVPTTAGTGSEAGRGHDGHYDQDRTGRDHEALAPNRGGNLVHPCLHAVRAEHDAHDHHEDQISLSLHARRAEVDADRLGEP